MKKKFTFFIVLFTIGIFILLGIALGRYFSTILGVGTVNAVCRVKMAEVIASAKGDVYNVATFSDEAEPASNNLVIYSVIGDVITKPIFTPVSNDLKDEQQNSALQTEAWQIFTKLIPAANRQMVAQYMIFTDEEGNTLAAVDQVENEPARWIVEVDIADLENKDALFFTLVHEYAHLLTLNDSQVTMDKDIYNDPLNTALLESIAAACPTYFTGTDCSLPNSYINTFYNRFWVDINSDWKKIDTLQYESDLIPYYEGLYNFYLARQDQFVDDYSTTHPAEDIAESFAYFVFSPKPDGDLIKDKKVLFFYEYPELIKLRQSILQGACE